MKAPRKITREYCRRRFMADFFAATKEERIGVVKILVAMIGVPQRGMTDADLEQMAIEDEPEAETAEQPASEPGEASFPATPPSEA